MPITNRRHEGNASIYLKYIELIVVRYLSVDHEDEEVLFSRRKLWLLLGMINEKYKKVDNKAIIEKWDNIVTEEDIDSFYLRTNSKLNRILKTALENLSKRKLINYEERTMICAKIGRKHKHFIADADQRKAILNIEYEILKEFKCADTAEIIYKKLASRYYNRVSEELNVRYGWEYYYKSYAIVFNSKHIKAYIPRLEQSLEEAVNELNRKIVEALNKEAETTYSRELKKYNDVFAELRDNSAIIGKLRYMRKPSDNYVVAQKILTNELVSISDSDVVDIDEVFDVEALKNDSSESTHPIDLDDSWLELPDDLLTFEEEFFT